MFEQVEILNKETHKQLRFKPAKDYSFAKDLNIVPVGQSEIVRCSKYFPVVFPAGGDLLPQAMLGIKKGENRFVTDQGQWTAPYIPAHIRRYPFIYGQADEQGNLALCIDPRAPQFGSDEGEPLFTEDGEPGEVLNQARDFLSRYQREIGSTQDFLQPLQDKEVLIDKQFTVSVGDKQSTIRGFRAVDKDRLLQVEDSVLKEWMQTGLLDLIYAHLHSLDNVGSLAV